MEDINSRLESCERCINRHQAAYNKLKGVALMYDATDDRDREIASYVVDLIKIEENKILHFQSDYRKLQLEYNKQQNNDTRADNIGERAVD